MTPDDFARSITNYKGRPGEDLGSKNFKYNFQARYLAPKREQMDEYVALLQEVLADRRVTKEECARLVAARESLSIDAPSHLEALRRLDVTPGAFEALLEGCGASHRSAFFKLVDLDGDGLISYEEYMLFHTLLAIPPRRLALVFHMFDADGSGTVEAAEFDAFMQVLRHETRAGRLETPGARPPAHELSAYRSLFRGRPALSLPDFLAFARALREAVLELQFASWDADASGTLDGAEFGKFLASCVSADRSLRAALRARADAPAVRALTRPIALADFVAFHGLLESLDALEVAMAVAGTEEGVTLAEFVRATSAAMGGHMHGGEEGAGVSAAVAEALFAMFDSDGNGRLNRDEFIAVMRREKEAFDPPREIGVVDFLRGVAACARKELPW
ncbi:hypothetical protein JKP88DRAFT_268910 [Tribonema minus]|uniref:EF-hand domain-containing protein n=1 Tax=Tribonema minus TaxID=303371 RepID=A0A836CPN4_9STRA|nr:hypothetical protein JKP88DRAFT_268910 [Tribonema minus]